MAAAFEVQASGRNDRHHQHVVQLQGIAAQPVGPGTHPQLRRSIASASNGSGTPPLESERPLLLNAASDGFQLPQALADLSLKQLNVPPSRRFSGRRNSRGPHPLQACLLLGQEMSRRTKLEIHPAP